MRRLFPVTAAITLGAMAFVWSPLASAQSRRVPRRPARTAPPVLIQQQPRAIGEYQEQRPNVGLITTGIVTLGLSYGASTIVAATSKNPADQRLYVPVAGPWMNLAERAPCQGRACGAEGTYRALLVANGIFQGLGALEILGGLLTTETRTVTATRRASPTTAQQKPSVRVTPTRFGQGAYGISAFGTF